MIWGMTYKGVHPRVELNTGTYPKGVRLMAKEMKPYERCIERLKDLGKWFITLFADVAQKLVAASR
jgi:hypothetical protein